MLFMTFRPFSLAPPPLLTRTVKLLRFRQIAATVGNQSHVNLRQIFMQARANTSGA